MRTTNASDPRVSPRPALLLIDFMNPLDFDGADDLAPRAVAAAQRAAILKSRMRARRAPVIYANDNFGRWESNFEAIVNYCKKLGGAPAKLASTLAPSPGDRSVLKPRHSAFFGTPLEFLLDELAVNQLILTGLSTDSCIMFTAHDGYLRKYDLWIPRDCVAAEKDDYQDAALEHMERTMKAVTDPVGDTTRRPRTGRESASRPGARLTQRRAKDRDE